MNSNKYKQTAKRIGFKTFKMMVFCALFFGFQNAVFSQELGSLIKEGLHNNPEVQKFELQYRIASEKVNEVNTIPNTEFGAGYFVSEPETRTGPQKFKLSVKQMIPWFGTLTARENYVSALAEAKYQDIAILKRQLAASISNAYYVLYQNKETQLVFEETIQLLKTYEKLALTGIESGKASVVDVLRLQVRQNELEQELHVLQINYLSEQSVLNLQLNRGKNTPITIETTFEIPENELVFNSENLQVHPELIKYDKLYESVSQLELLNQKEKAPAIGFGLDYINVSKNPDMTFADNGKDIIMPMVTVSIPIFNKKFGSVTKQNQWEQERIEFEKTNKFNTLQTVLDKAIKQKNVARVRYTMLLKNSNQTKKAETILLKTYETGTLDFTAVLEVQELLLKFQTNTIESIKNYCVQASIINYLTQ
ncbi:TolC family protein [Bizionia saleffrena]|nr:TolC family protein [Bizionia saleffrena]